MTAVYLDHAATTPLSARAQQAWLEAVGRLQGNPSSLHAGGRAARRMLEDARDRIGAALGADKNEVLFTSGATESDALGVLGAARGARAENPARKRIVVSGVEHDAVAEQQGAAELAGFTWDVLPVGQDGKSLVDVGDPGTVAVASMSLVSAETGIIQPVAQLAESGVQTVHTDAAQAVGQIPVNFAELGVQLLTVGGHKVGAPVGTGVLVASRATKVVTDRAGGGQERKFRSGTVDVAGACALAAALEEVTQNLQRRMQHAQTLRDALRAGLPTGIRFTSEALAAPGIVHLSLPTAHPEVLLLMMDQAGIMVSAGSACHAGVTRPSEILLRMGRSEKEALGVLRVSFGTENTVADVDAFLAALPAALEAAQGMDRRDK